MMDIEEEKYKKEYQDRIPEWCYYQTVEQHMECLMLCWRLAKGPMTEEDCKSCDNYTPRKGE
jgi:hypothetical protein